MRSGFCLGGLRDENQLRITLCPGGLEWENTGFAGVWVQLCWFLLLSGDISIEHRLI